MAVTLHYYVEVVRLVTSQSVCSLFLECWPPTHNITQYVRVLELQYLYKNAQVLARKVEWSIELFWNPATGEYSAMNTFHFI